ncbi:metallophosphoesterase [Stutzerimonas xanthomarina]|uniref:Calcineurin-like phosphoesterase n=2 Tax=Stutzerimonas xanthomarina TaxID=271420 RepID=A0A1M5RU62_9GAMM|nr:metallophosphoesterase [Stutzerimonas xanthomarina]MCP9339318.1 metallophosphoesterase [Stutzerimonas xanthomarina]SEH93883.1 Calcineurin-like phosphoesterase [Stutzerimonas xanthomarina]SHH29847.1 Calcineurin-like phosphoesterase [Stutzerimonas xanthomarina DSM 18231]
MFVDPERSYDLIGDVHGCAHTLAHLLDQLGYRRHGDVWRHPRRQVIFLGDIIDRGPRIREALHLVHAMVEAEQAHCIMGNHEFNALGWYIPAPPESGKTFVREHTPRYGKLLEQTFEQFEHYPDEWRAFRDWFMELPLFLESERFRVVHACWDSGVIDQLRKRLNRARVDHEFLRDAAFADGFAAKALDRLLRGTDMPLPQGLTLTSAEGFKRSFFRTKFWEEDPQTYGDVVFQPDGLPEHAARMPLSQSQKSRLFLYGPDEPLLFVGHYWRSGTPAPIRSNLACLDYSAVMYGKLVAYRLDEETRLDPAKFVWVDVER